MKMFKNGLSLKWLLAAFLCAALFGCTADYDTFGQSDYRVFNEIAFEEGESGAMLYADEHKIVVSLDEIPDSLETWDSATISLLDISSMATLHLVDGKFKEFPSDSAALDSLAQELSYVKDRLHEGDKVRIPSSGTVYLMLVSESGIPSLWQVVFEIPEKKVKSSSSNKESGDTDAKSSSSSVKEGSSSSKTGDSSSGKSDASSSSKEPAGSSSSVKGDNSASSGDGNSSAGGDEPESSSSVAVPANAPKLLRLIAGAGEVEAEIDQDAGTVFLNMNYAIDLDLRDLEIKGLELSDGATASVKVGESYNFARGLKVTLENDGVERTYTVKAGYQYPGSDFNTWVKDDFNNMNDIDGWDNGNNSYAKELTTNAEGKSVIKMESQTAVIKFASGNMLVAYFNPKGVSAISMAGYEDGNELIDFGRPFYGRPKYVEFDVKYDGKKDSCDLYVILENRSRTSNEGKNQYRTSSDVNTMVASAWYRATTVESEDDPDVVSITDAEREGYKTIRLAFKYGLPYDSSPIYNSSVLTKGLKNKNGIDNHLDPTDSPDDFDVTHIRVVMASSALGNLYKGSVGATLWADEMRLIY
ncbi:Putative carbohydrate metabolism domain-containing protein [Fibrobacter sp. UWCM]|uniref:PCMD domain-containing protein n=1 Tax=Fibrobacter sp. UWCM TaxID=1896208 RepID=UPI00091FD8B4|nr:PCMD domain-containing protein [Fibrobacter sp. UWCM]SHH11439.1 Putative carbohydrate metabolism domain-containing protein [Fibrobacter sp. UWCM]